MRHVGKTIFLHEGYLPWNCITFSAVEGQVVRHFIIFYPPSENSFSSNVRASEFGKAIFFNHWSEFLSSICTDVCQREMIALWPADSQCKCCMSLSPPDHIKSLTTTFNGGLGLTELLDGPNQILFTNLKFSTELQCDSRSQRCYWCSDFARYG